MRRNRKDNTKKERIVMLAASAFVLTALTMTGIYMQTKEEEEQDDGYTLDFTALEDNATDKYEEIAQNQTEKNIAENPPEAKLPELSEVNGLEDELDYMPLEAGSGQIKIPGLTDVTDSVRQQEEQPKKPTEGEDAETPKKAGISEEPEENIEPRTEETAREEPTDTEIAQTSTDSRELHFAESEGLLRPLEGEVLIPFSMDGSVYFTTLDQYKYNPALMLVAEEGTTVTACAEGKVVDIFENAVFGRAVTMDLGDGYQITYGQLKDINVSVDSYVNPGDVVGLVAAPTKYFNKEGANLYLKLTVNDTPVNPEKLFR